MEWNVTLLAVHAIALVFSVMLYGKAPCWMQKLVVVGFIFGFFAMSVGYAAAIAGEWWSAYTLDFGLALEHISVLIYIFRIVWQGGLGHGHPHRVTAAH